MQFPCARCARTYEIADELVVGRAVKVACPACGNLAVHRVPVPDAAPAPLPLPPLEAQPNAFADADDDDFENAWASVESPFGAEQPWPAPLPPEPPPPPQQQVAAKPVASAPSTPPRAAPPAPKPAPASPPAVSFDEEEPVMVTAELVLRRSHRRARLGAAAVAVVVIAAVVGGGAFALRWKREAVVVAIRGPLSGSAGASSSEAPAGGLSEGDLAKLMGKRAPDPAEANAMERPAPSSDRPKHLKLSGKDKGLLDLLAKKGDAAVTVQEEDAASLATSRAALDSKAVEGTIARNGGSFSACVSRAMAADPGQKLNGKRVTLELTVRPSGRVQKATLGEQGIARSPLGVCIAQAAKRMVFPGFDGESIDISAPLVLKVVF